MDESAMKQLWAWADPNDMGYLNEEKRKRFILNYGLKQLKWACQDGTGRMRYQEFRQALLDLPDEERKAVLKATVASEVIQTRGVEGVGDVVSSHRHLFSFFDTQGKNVVDVAEVRRFIDTFRISANWNGIPKTGTLTFDQYLDVFRNFRITTNPAWDDVVSGYRALWVFVAGSEGASLGSEDSRNFATRLRVGKHGSTNLLTIIDLVELVERLERFLPMYIKNVMATLGTQAITTGLLRRWRKYTMSNVTDLNAVFRALYSFFDDGSGRASAADVYRFAAQLNVAWPSYIPQTGFLSLEQFAIVFRDLYVTSVNTDEVVAGLRTLWNWADIDRSGKLDPAERVRFMTRLGLKSITWRDTDRDGQMDFNEFWAMCEEMYNEEHLFIFVVAGMLGKRRTAANRTASTYVTAKPDTPRNPVGATTFSLNQRLDAYSLLFNFFDIGGQGHINYNEWKEFVTLLQLKGVTLPQSSSEYVSQSEFRRFFSDWTVRNSFSRDDAFTGLQALWRWADKDGSGKLDANERLRFMLRLGLREIQWPDLDGDSLMSFDEFFRMVLALPEDNRERVLAIGALLNQYGNVRFARGSSQSF
eukprot:TRINITY_DN17398_c0_g1_i1.p1 TRINITY_DN17398_c0_g1~~TRINITY_DN17398_c0_g1_i1.p1  ORF type:complete len:588 (-),score=63.06 TRINITY_DN17398_c0_g1_i1:106-1869(-)